MRLVAEFQSTRPVRGATSPALTARATRSRFNPRAPCGARRATVCHDGRSDWFQSTRPVRGATTLKLQTLRATLVSIHAPRAGRDAHLVLNRQPAQVSIHAPRAGRDGFARSATRGRQRFQSTRPVRGATGHRDYGNGAWLWFQSTRPVRGATTLVVDTADAAEFQSTRPRPASPTWRFNPRAPCGARRGRPRPQPRARAVSIHAPRAGRDLASTSLALRPTRFQSTRPVRGATRSSCKHSARQLFQSTRPVRGATHHADTQRHHP